jgi:hypothetical protein
MPIVSRAEPLGRVARLWADDAGDDPSEAARRLIRGVVMGQFAVVSLLGKEWWFVAKDTLQKISQAPCWRMSLEETAKAIVAQWSRFEPDQHGTVCAVRSGSPFARAPMEGELPDRAAILSEVVLTEMVNEVLRMKVSRDEFLRWMTEQGYPRPTFWGDDTPVSPLSSYTARDAWIEEEARRPQARDWAATCVRCRDECDGWEDRERRQKPASGFTDQTLTKLIRAARKRLQR